MFNFLFFSIQLSRHKIGNLSTRKVESIDSENAIKEKKKSIFREIPTFSIILQFTLDLDVNFEIHYLED